MSDDAQKVTEALLMVTRALDDHLDEPDFPAPGCRCGYDGGDVPAHLAGVVLAALDLPARYAKVRAETLREAADKVQAVFDLQCPPATPSAYVDRGAYMAHKWWDTVLGGKLRDLRASAAAALASAGPVEPSPAAEGCPWDGCSKCAGEPLT